jgi:hypothetical protein
MSWNVTREAAKIVRYEDKWPKDYPPMKGWWIVQYADGAKMCCHESRMEP